MPEVTGQLRAQVRRRPLAVQVDDPDVAQLGARATSASSSTDGVAAPPWTNTCWPERISRHGFVRADDAHHSAATLAACTLARPMVKTGQGAVTQHVLGDRSEQQHATARDGRGSP